MIRIEWFSELNAPAALQRAGAEDRPLFVDFWAPGCKGCERMDDATYQDTAVGELLTDEFVAIRYNTHAPNEFLKRLAGTTLLLWTPTLVVSDASAGEFRRVVGHLPAQELIDELRIALGLRDLRRRRWPESCDRFDQIAHGATREELAAEALYWLGVAMFYHEGKSIDALADPWRQLGTRYPGSTWSSRADVLTPIATTTMDE